VFFYDMYMKILYGTEIKNIDVTTICYDKLLTDNIIRIPSSERERAELFTDPVYGELKQIYIVNSDVGQLTKHDHTKVVYIDTINNQLYEDGDVPEHIQYVYGDIDTKLEIIHKNIQLKYGSMKDEFPEQKMAVRFLTGNERVMELGSNVGRNSMIIAHILKQKNNNRFVTVESDPEAAGMLKANMEANGFNFHIINAALSKRRLIQKGWDTFESDVDVDGYQRVKTITLKDINTQYRIKFDTLVIDCEGAFYYILKDMPEILNNVKLIMMENDYRDPEHKKYVDQILTEHKFKVEYSEPLTSHEGLFPHCREQFYQVWKRPKPRVEFV
jgi:FkbM family methyltransferase